MSEIKLISPMLDDFIIGDVFSDHNGVRCVPAMKNNSDTRYIVKVISIPASQVQLQAFLLTGIYRTPESAKEYFTELVSGVENELTILSKLSKLEGFLDYEAYQVVEKEDEVGYDIYLLATYKRSLDRHFRKYPMTHLAAVNLGLDMCAALSVCRQTGYLYCDLKPGNIFINDDNEYRIGDIGFLPLNGLRFATLHDRYRSPYTAPELQDPIAPISESSDIYAAGLILYQAYNGGALPFQGLAPNEVLQPPLYADYEMSEIILKACAPDPADRWEDPIKMGQAIVSYMQRNGANDTPIAPPIVRDEPHEEAAPAAGDEATPALLPTDEEAAAQIGQNEEDALIIPGFLTDEAAVPGEEPPVEEAASVEAAEAPAEEDVGNLSFMDEMVNDETAPAEEMAEEIVYSELSDDANDILAQVDELIAHETPNAADVLENTDAEISAAVEETLADPTDETENAAEDPLSKTVAQISLVVEASENAIETQLDPGIELPVDESTEESEDLPEAVQDEQEDILGEELADEDMAEEKPKSSIGSKILVSFLIFVIIACIGVAGFLFYNNYYMKTVDKLTIVGVDNRLTVSVLTDADPDLLSVICTDTYGNKQTAPMLGGAATFSDLAPDTLYKITLDISGFHGLKGDIKGTYTTAPQTEVMSFTAITGAEAGTAILNFTVKGHDSESWVVTYTAPGEQERSQTFSGHTTTITDLTLDATYTFTLDSSSNVYVFGQNKLDYTAGELVYPEALTVTSFTDEGITVTWETPEGITVPQWTVMCYNDSGYSQNVTTAENTASFTGVDRNGSYTIEVTAAGMSVGERFFLSKNTVAVTDFVTALNGKYLDISWKFAGNTPAGSWILTYVFENEETEVAVSTEGTTARIENVVPKGNYTFTLRLDDGTTVVNDIQTVKVDAAADFQAYGVSKANLTFAMCVPPDIEDWIWWGAKERTTEFTVGEKAGFVMHVNNYYQYVEDPVTIMCVVRDKDGQLLSVSTADDVWTKMWIQNYGEITLTNMPQEIGEYTVEIYFNSTFVHEQTFTVS